MIGDSTETATRSAVVDPSIGGACRTDEFLQFEEVRKLLPRAPLTDSEYEETESSGNCLWDVIDSSTECTTETFARGKAMPVKAEPPRAAEENIFPVWHTFIHFRDPARVPRRAKSAPHLRPSSKERSPSTPQETSSTGASSARVSEAQAPLREQEFEGTVDALDATQLVVTDCSSECATPTAFQPQTRQWTVSAYADETVYCPIPTTNEATFPVLHTFIHFKEDKSAAFPRRVESAPYFATSAEELLPPETLST